RDVVVEVIEELKPRLVLFGATPWGRTVAPRVAAKIRTGLTADCLDIYVDENGDIVQVRPAFTGNLIAHIKTLTEPVMATVRYRVFKPLDPDYSRQGKVIVRRIGSEVLDKYRGFELLGLVRRKEVNLADAEVVVSGGRGFKSKEDLKMLEELAKLLNGVVGASRPLVDSGWISKEHQVGFSGNIVKPRVYIAFGISGAPQHLAGMKDSQLVITVNIDPSAPIAKYCDLFVVGDLYEILPRLIEELKKIKGRR
ncbi:MAG: electron transfer flavoprotein subunit alpha/FixB family protein, partial [Thermoprotei archaeon]